MATQTEQSLAVVMRYCEEGIPRALAGDRASAHDYLADHFVQHTTAHNKGGKQNVEDRKDSIDEAVRAIPDLRFTVDRYVADGEYVVSHWRIEGTHRGRYQHRHAGEHLEGTGADADIRGMTMYHVEQGKISESWGYDTHLDFLIDAGALKLHK